MSHVIDRKNCQFSGFLALATVAPKQSLAAGKRTK